MGERRLVALLKGATKSHGDSFSINISPLRGFSRQTFRGLSGNSCRWCLCYRVRTASGSDRITRYT
jgi:hypothetical protein